MSDAPGGYFGPATSTVDFCESNYAISRYVAEFFNTASSLFIVLAALLGLGLHHRAVERRFQLAFVAVALVGVGSTAFHATLRFELQMLDELPMLYSALIMVFILTERRLRGRWRAAFPFLLLAHGVLVTSLTAFTRGPLQFYLFHLSFGSLEVLALACAWLASRRHTNTLALRQFRRGMGCYLAGILVWFVDLKYCDFLGTVLPAHGIANPQLHALWHLLVAAGFYQLLVFLIYDRLVALEKGPRLERWAFGIWRARV
jgi:dihydroceramidase